MATVTRNFTGKQVVEAFITAAQRNRDNMQAGKDTEGQFVIDAFTKSAEGIAFLLKHNISEDQIVGLVQGIVIGLDLADSQQ